MKSLDQETCSYFNKRAATWHMDVNGKEDYIRQILSDTEISPGQTVLDIGCGSGVLVPFIQTLVSATGILLEVDFALNMTRQVRRTFPSVHAICADALDFPLKANQIDRILIFHAFPHFADHHQAITECRRILKPGGQICIFHLKCSRQINAFHLTLEQTVRSHQLPQATQMRVLLEQHNFHVLQADEQPDKYCVRGRK
jgi:ubiquinone/menaquinone biosynthesis C-methylase UbiE